MHCCGLQINPNRCSSKRTRPMEITERHSKTLQIVVNIIITAITIIIIIVITAIIVIDITWVQWACLTDQPQDLESKRALSVKCDA